VLSAWVVGGRSDCIGEHQSRIADCTFERALHLGAGRDNYRINEYASGQVVALNTDRTTLAEHGARERVLGCGQRLPFADDSFDLVFSEYVFADDLYTGEEAEPAYAHGWEGRLIKPCTLSYNDSATALCSVQ
jgi:hypothetical protein